MNTRSNLDLPHQGRSDSEAGFMLVFAIVMVALVLIALAVAAPIMAKDLQRDKELESAHRAQQYVRAIRLYYRKTKTYPPSIDALENTNNVRFLRKRYIDPLTGKDDWRIIHVGENKTTVKGFFGQPLGGLNTTGAGSLGSASSMASGGIGGNTAGSAGSTVSGGSALAGGFQGATMGGPTSGSSAIGTSSSSSSSGPLGSGGVGQIMGVGTSKTGESILNPNEQATYETWEFIYDPKIELLYQQANTLGGPASINSQSPSSMTTTNPGQPNTTGGSNNTTPNAPSGPQ